MSDCKKLTDVSVNNLGNVLSKMKYLEKMELYMSRCSKITINGLTSLIESIDQLTKLKDVKLFIKTNDKIHDSVIAELGKKLTKVKGNLIIS